MDNEQIPTPTPQVEVKEEVVLTEDTEKKKTNIFKIIFNVIFTIIIIAILGNAILGVVNFNRLSNEQSAYIFTDVSEEEKDGITYHYYPQGLFKIIHEQNGKDEKWILRPFFLN